MRYTKETYGQFLLIAAVGLLIYSNTFSVPFIFDDEYNIVNNQTIKSLDNFISSDKDYEHNPRRFIGYLTFALNYHFGGLNVAGYHVVNLAIHLINAFLVYFLVVLTFRTPFFSDQRSAVSDQKEVEGRVVKRLSGHDSTTQQLDNSTIHDSQSLIALFSALLFVAHPVQTQAVTYIVQRFTSLTALFYLLAMVMYIKGRQWAMGNGQWAKDKGVPIAHRLSPIAYYVLSLLVAVLAMKTKETAFTLPIMILLYEFTFFRSSLRRKLLFLVPVLLTLVIIPISMLHVDKPLGEVLSDLSEKTRLQTDMSRGDYLMTEMRVIVTYIRLILLPINQSLDYDYPIYHSPFALPVLASFLFLLSLAGIAVYLLYTSGQGAIGYGQKDKNKEPEVVLPIAYGLSPIACQRLIAFGILWFFLALSVESSFIPIVDVIFEHRIYLPSVGAFIALTAALFAAAARMGKRWRWTEKALISLLLTTVLLLSVATFARNMVWQDAVGLYEDNVRNQPSSFRAHLNLGVAYGYEGRLEEAMAELRTAVRLNPNSVRAHEKLQEVFVIMGRPEDAESELRYLSAITHYEQGAIYNKQGRLEDAVKELTAAVALKSDYAYAYNGLGIIYDRQGRLEDAVRELQTAIRVKPDYAEAHNNLGIVYAKQGYLREAEDHFQTAVAMKPDYREAKKNLERILTLKETGTTGRSAHKP